MRTRIEKRTAGSKKRRGGKSRAMINSAGKRKKASRPYAFRKSKFSRCVLIVRSSS
jgi:hypothetical protein